MSTITGADLAAQRNQLKVAIYALYGVQRAHFAKLIQGTAPITPTIELIYQLTRRYPDVIPRPPTAREFLELLATQGITRYADACRLLGKGRSAMHDYLGLGRARPIPPSFKVSALMRLLQRLLATHPLQEIQPIIAQAPVSPAILAELEQRLPPTRLRELLGIEITDYWKQRRQSAPLGNTLSISCLLLKHYPELSADITPPAFAERLRQQGVRHYKQMSLYLGRNSQTYVKYRAGETYPAGPTLALMRLIVRFLETHPLAEYVALVQDVAATRGVDLQRPGRIRW